MLMQYKMHLCNIDSARVLMNVFWLISGDEDFSGSVLEFDKCFKMKTFNGLLEYERDNMKVTIHKWTCGALGSSNLKGV